MKRNSKGCICGRWIAALALLCVGVAGVQGADKPALGDGLSFYAGFDGSAEPDCARGASTVKGEYHPAEGVAGKAIEVQSDPPSYQQTGNLDREAGTLSFWVKPAIDLKAQVNQGPATRGIFSAVNFALRAYTNQPNMQPVIYFMTGATLPGKDFQWDYGATAPIGSFPAGKWAHVALTWKRATGQKAIYIDGKRVAANSSPLIEPGDGGDLLTLGERLPGAYDELAIWRRVLTPMEIHFLAKKPAEAAAALAMVAKSQARHDVPWVIYPGLIYQNYADSLIAPDEALALKLPLENRTDQEQAGIVTIEVQDVWDKPAGEAQKFDVKLAAKEKRELPFTVAVKKFGAYRVAVTVEVGGVQLSRDVTTFGCLPKDPPPKHPFFGGHISQVGTMPEMGRRLGFCLNRVHNMTQFTWWFRMEPRPGEWAMDGAGAYQRYMDLGYTHYGQWMYAPYWAVKLPDGKHPVDNGTDWGSSFPPTDLPAMREYVRQSLERFPAIKEWEIWNEPYVSMFWRGAPKDYVELCKVIYTEARKARPDITIYSQLYFEGPWTREAMKLGVLNYCDAVAYHFYHHPNNDPQSATDPIRKLRALLAQNGRPDMPITASEGGMDSTTFMRGLDFADLPPQEVRPAMDYRESAGAFVQAHVVMIANGVRAWYYYFHQPVTPDMPGLWKYVNYSTMEVTNSPKPTAIARAELAWQLDGGKFVADLKTTAEGVRAYAFDRQDGHAVAVMWAEEGAVAQLHVPAGFRAVDLMGNPIGSSAIEVAAAPMYLHAADLEQLRTALVDKAVVTLVRGPQKGTVSKGGAPAPKKMYPFPIAAEVGPGKMFPLDLSGVANSSLADDVAGDGKGWMDEGPYNDFRNMTTGKHTWLGVPFVISGKTIHDNNVLTMKGKTFPNGPRIAGPIDVGDRGLRGLFFAHAANWTEEGKAVGEYIVHYEDGQEVKLPIVVGQNIGNWWFDHADSEESRTAWFDAADPLQPEYPYRFLRVWYWENTRPDAKVKSISVRSLSNDMTFTVVAITAAAQ